MSSKILLQSAPARPSPGLRPYCIVLRDLGGAEGGHRYVTHRMGLDSLGGFSTGHYYRYEDEGRDDFVRRCSEDHCALPEDPSL